MTPSDTIGRGQDGGERHLGQLNTQVHPRLLALSSWEHSATGEGVTKAPLDCYIHQPSQARPRPGPANEEGTRQPSPPGGPEPEDKHWEGLEGQAKPSEEGFPGERAARLQLEKPGGASRCMGASAGLTDGESQAGQGCMTEARGSGGAGETGGKRESQRRETTRAF